MVDIISRSQWGAKAWNGQPYSVPLSDRRYFLVHYHGGPPPQSTGEWVPKNVEAIHLGNGWSGTGYNFMVGQDGKVYEGRGWGLQGAHCPGRNRDGFGVYVAIGGDQETTQAALRSVRALYDEANRKTGRTLIKSWHGANYATACPGPKLIAWVKGGMKVDGKPAADTGAQSIKPKPTPKPKFKPLWKPTGRMSVRQIQKAVGVTADGLYGESTRAAVKKYQGKLGVAADGLWGKSTEAAHNSGGKSKGALLAVDGIEGAATVKELQRHVGAKVDGIRGRSTNKAMQKWLGVAQDGKVGPATIRALQSKVGTPVDGIWGRNTTRALQRYLNEH